MMKCLIVHKFADMSKKLNSDATNIYIVNN